MILVQHIEVDVDAALQLGEPLQQAMAEAAPDQEVKLVAGKAADPGGSDQPVQAECALAGCRAGKNHECLAFEESPEKRDDVKPVVVVGDQVIDVDLHGAAALNSTRVRSGRQAAMTDRRSPFSACGRTGRQGGRPRSPVSWHGPCGSGLSPRQWTCSSARRRSPVPWRWPPPKP